MKKIYFLSIFFILLGGLVSCSKFLDDKPISQRYDTGGFGGDSLLLKTAGDAENAISSVYSRFKNAAGELFFYDWFANSDVHSDNAYAGGDSPDFFQIDQFNVNATNTTMTRDWAHYYEIVSDCNNVINNVPKITDPALTSSRKNEIIGEASFVRAFIYFDLVRLWGSVPLVLAQVTAINTGNLPTVYPQLYPSRTSVDSVYAQIITDLTTSLGQSPVSGPTKFIGTKDAANALLAKVYATIEPHDWTKVGQYCDAVISSGNYSLLSDYDQLWDGMHENSTESIFELDCTDWGTGGNWGPYLYANIDLSYKRFFTPSNELIKAFNDEGDTIRRNSTITYLDASGKWTDQYWPLNHYPFINKYRDNGSGGQNQIFIRLADILLLKAEALTELNDIPDAAALVNQIRSRVHLPNTTAASQEDMRLAIEKERQLEFAFEGQRWFDLVRTERAINVMNAQVDGNGNSLGYNLTPEKLIWPIPQSERDKNPHLTQNPGY